MHSQLGSTGWLAGDIRAPDFLPLLEGTPIRSFRAFLRS